MAETQLDRELGLLKATFKGNEHLLKVMRALFFGFEMTTEEKELIRSSFRGADLRLAVRKKIFSQMGDDAVIGSVPDFWLNVSPQQLIGASPDTVYQIIQSKKQLLGMFKQAVSLLENPDGLRVDISFDPGFLPSDTLGVRLIARNLYVQAMETSLHFINQAANQPEPETPAQVAKKQLKNSSK